MSRLVIMSVRWAPAGGGRWKRVRPGEFLIPSEFSTEEGGHDFMDR